MEHYKIQKIAVLGAGVMGAQIAAHFTNCGFETLLYDLAGEGDNKNLVIEKAIKHLNVIKPSPVATPKTTELLKPKNYNDDLSDLSSCDFIIEAIAERVDIKQSLYKKISPYINKRAIIASNTSGISINQLSSFLDTSLQSQFCGVHFFNPPRHMNLVELIPASHTNSACLDYLETWLTTYIGKNVVRAKDTPNFIANRIGVFSLLSIIDLAQTFELSPDEVDAITGELIGRPKSATFRTLDVVGLDTMEHVVHTMTAKLKNDPWHSIFSLPNWIESLIKQGMLGQKTNAGIYRKEGRDIYVFDTKNNDYRPITRFFDETLLDILKISNTKEKMQALFSSDNKYASFLSAYYKDLFIYCAYHLSEIAECVQDVDDAMCSGFGWEKGPFQLWEAAGLHEIQSSLKKRANELGVSLPNWLDHITCFYHNNESFNPSAQKYIKTKRLPVYEKQLLSTNFNKKNDKQVIFEDDGVRLADIGQDVGVLEFKSRANMLSQAVIEGCHKALIKAQVILKGIVIYSNSPHIFSAGANLKEVNQFITKKAYSDIESMVINFQNLMQRIKFSPIPIVGAVRGRALGGGTEVILHCATTISHFESYLGLVEVGVGLIPAGGGLKELALDASLNHQIPVINQVKIYFEQIAKAMVSISAKHAKQLNYLKKNSHILMNSHELLNAAVSHVTHLSELNYKPNIERLFSVAGREGASLLKGGLVNWHKGEFISDHDFFITSLLADVICGGDVPENTSVSEAWILKLEREAFMTLIRSDLTQARIQHFIDTGKPLRN